MLRKISAVSAISLALLSGAASAAGPVADKTFKHWHVYTIAQGKTKVCYITSAPVDEKGNYKNRGDAYTLVTYRPAKGLSEVSISSGYPFKENSMVELKIDKRLKKDMFTTTETPRIAWAKTGSEDKEIVSAMKQGSHMRVKGYSRLGTYSQDKYSLSGFTAAYKRMIALCK